MPRYRRADTPLASERGTIDGMAWSHLLHAHHYRSESRKKYHFPADDLLWARFQAAGVAIMGIICTWFTWECGTWPLALLFGYATARWVLSLF